MRVAEADDAAPCKEQDRCSGASARTSQAANEPPVASRTGRHGSSFPATAQAGRHAMPSHLPGRRFLPVPAPSKERRGEERKEEIR